MKLLICLPSRNEEKILEKNVNFLYNFLKSEFKFIDWKIVISVNGSNDNTINIAKHLKKIDNKKISFLEIKESGKGRAIKHCFDSYLNFDILMYMDVDLAVSLENLKHLIEPIYFNKADLCMGNRFHDDSKIKRNILRSYFSKMYNFFSRIILNHKFSDLQCGFKAINIDTYNRIRPYIKNNYWFFDTEWVMICKKMNFNIKEIAVNWQDNRYEIRKSQVKIILETWRFMIAIIKLKFYLRKINK